jgi:transcriptional regulator with XRE-family HTH domain
VTRQSTGLDYSSERIAWYRRRRGLSQEVLAGLIGRTVDWLSKVENSRIEIDRISVIRSLSDALDVSIGDLLNEPSLVEWTADSGSRTVPAVRAALMDYRQLVPAGTGSGGQEPLPLAQLERSLDEVWLAYQDSRFGYVTRQVPQLIADTQLAASTYAGDQASRAHDLLALTYHATASTLTKVGEADLAWIAADRGLVAAQRNADPVVLGSLFRSVTHSLLSTGRYAEAVQMTEQAAFFLNPHLGTDDGSMLSVYGTLLLAGSMAAARAENRSTTGEFLNEAEELARRLGRDSNHLWTAFGPTNVEIHRVSTAMELGDFQLAVEMGPRVDTAALPVERRVRHALEVARALSMRNRRDEAIAAVLDAEQVAPEQVRYHYMSRHLVQTWVRQQRGKPSFQLTGLAERLRVL